MVALLAEGVDRNPTAENIYRKIQVVALLAEGVDRNPRLLPAESQGGVALLAEGVDRNAKSNREYRRLADVALLAEGVDRNPRTVKGAGSGCKSPSSRRAWIEIFCRWKLQCFPTSPSSRRAWIEMWQGRKQGCAAPVALLAEGVDRNGHGRRCGPAGRQSPSSRRAWIEIRPTRSRVRAGTRRPPRGGRG